MNINEIISSLANALKADSFFKNIKVIKSYPYEFYAGELRESLVCIELDEVEISPAELGDDTKYGEVKIKLGIFTPNNRASLAKDIFLNVCRVAQDFNVVTVKADALEYSKQSKGFELNSYFTFSGEIDFGGESGE